MSSRRRDNSAQALPTTPTSSRSPPPSSYRPTTSSSSTGGTDLTNSLSAPAAPRVRNRLSRNFEDALRDPSTTVQLSAGGLDEDRLGVVFTPPRRALSSASGSGPSVSVTTPDSASSASGSFMTTRNGVRILPTPPMQPATPTIVPPTPQTNGTGAVDPAADSESAQMNASFASDSAPPDNSMSLAPPDAGTGPGANTGTSTSNKRRSMLRSAGTASSPDLATLVRKARERGGIIGESSKSNANATSSSSNSKGQDIQRPLPSASTSPQPSSSPSAYKSTHAPSSFLSPLTAPRTRATSSTSSFSIVSNSTDAGVSSGGQTLRSSASAKKLARATPGYNPATVANSDGLLSSPGRSASGSSGRESGKSSMRSKANTFLKQFMGGGGSVRDKKRALSLTSSLQPPPQAEEPPPVPPLPTPSSATSSTITASSTVTDRDHEDVFTSSASSEGPPRIPSKDKVATASSSSRPATATSNTPTIRPRSSSKGSHNGGTTPTDRDREPSSSTTIRPPSSLSSSSQSQQKSDPLSLFSPNYAPVASGRTASASNRPHTAEPSSTHSTRRRSVSVGSVDISKLGLLPDSLSRPSTDSTNTTTTAPHLREWDIAMRTVMGSDDFTGAFKGLTNPITPRKDRDRPLPSIVDGMAAKPQAQHASTFPSGSSNWPGSGAGLGMGIGGTGGGTGAKAQLQPPSRPSGSSSGRSTSDETAPWSARTSQSSAATSSHSSTTTRRSSAPMLDPINTAKGRGDTLRLVSSPAASSMRRSSSSNRAEGVPLPETPGTHASADGGFLTTRRAPSPTLSTPSEDVFFDAESTRSSVSNGTGHTTPAFLSPTTTPTTEEPRTPVAGRLQIPGSSHSSSSGPSPSSPSYDGRLGVSSSSAPSGTGRDIPRTPILSPRKNSVRLPARSPNPFQPAGYGHQAFAAAAQGYGQLHSDGLVGKAAAASTPALSNTMSGASSTVGPSGSGPRTVPALRSTSTGGIVASNAANTQHKQSPSRGTITTITGGGSGSRAGSLEIPLRRSTGKDNLTIASRAGSSSSYTGSPKQAMSSLPGNSSTEQSIRTVTPSSLVNSSPTAAGVSYSSAGYVSEDGTLLAPDNASTHSGSGSASGGITNRTIRLVGTGASATSIGGASSESSTTNNNTLGSSSIYTGNAGSAVSMSSYSQTDLILSRYPSSTKMAQAAAAGAVGSAIAGAGGSTDPDELENRARVCAEKCWAEDESFLAIEKMAEWLGGRDPVKQQALKFYMDNFDFTGHRLDIAFRNLCGKLFLRAETQQVDRILEVFSAKFWECNPQAVYHSADVVHAITYSIMLLNTDLHIAEIANRMSRSQFIKNTLSVVLDQIDALDVESPYSNPAAVPSTASLDEDEDGTLEGTTPAASSPPSSRPPTVRYHHHPKNRSGSLTSWRSIMQHAGASQSAIQLGSADDSPIASRVSLNLPSSTAAETPAPGYFDSPERRASREQVTSGGRKLWEQEMENFLKEVYDAVKKQQILQPIAARGATPSLGGLHRRGSQRNHSTDRLNNLKRGSVRGLSSLLSQQSTVSNNDGRASPSPSFATSIGENLAVPSSTFHAPTLGFASNLSHSIIKETHEDDARSLESVDTASTSVSISDEELALLGAPWAKEGMLCRKQFWENSKRRAKARNWLDVFVVISKGEFSMFTFGEHGPASSVNSVGGGNWLSNANLVGEFSLAHSLAHALPAPGYNRQRPYCFVLTLSSGAVYFFQAGTEELIAEWVSTCNYWAARQSREPLSGGVSNMEYGWSRIQDALDDGDDPTVASRKDQSDTMSIRSNRSGRLQRISSNLGRASSYNVPAERMFIHEWKPPMAPSLASTNDEETQLESLQKQVGSLKLELERHNALRKPMLEMFPGKSSNGTKALNNWEQKSQYLLSELVKYQSYVESLRDAMSLRLKRRGERALERALEVPSDSDSDGGAAVPKRSPAKKAKGLPPTPQSTASGGGTGGTGGTNTLGRRSSAIRPSTGMSVQETIQEADEPVTPAPGGAFGTLHRRQRADAGR